MQEVASAQDASQGREVGVEKHQGPGVCIPVSKLRGLVRAKIKRSVGQG